MQQTAARCRQALPLPPSRRGGVSVATAVGSRSASTRAALGSAHASGRPGARPRCGGGEQTPPIAPATRPPSSSLSSSSSSTSSWGTLLAASRTISRAGAWRSPASSAAARGAGGVAPRGMAAVDVVADAVAVRLSLCAAPEAARALPAAASAVTRVVAHTRLAVASLSSPPSLSSPSRQQGEERRRGKGIAAAYEQLEAYSPRDRPWCAAWLHEAHETVLSRSTARAVCFANAIGMSREAREYTRRAAGMTGAASTMAAMRVLFSASDMRGACAMALPMACSSVKKKRQLKMNKHKLRKRRKRDKRKSGV